MKCNYSNKILNVAEKHLLIYIRWRFLHTSSRNRNSNSSTSSFKPISKYLSIRILISNTQARPSTYRFFSSTSIHSPSKRNVTNGPKMTSTRIPMPVVLGYVLGAKIPTPKAPRLKKTPHNAYHGVSTDTEDGLFLWWSWSVSIAIRSDWNSNFISKGWKVG